MGCSPRPAPVTLSVECRPGVSQVFLDGRYAGQTPLWRHSLGPGTHRLLLTQNGHFPHGADIQVSGETRYFAVMLPKTGTLSPVIWPPPDRFFIDRMPRELSNTYTLPVGTHELSVWSLYHGYHQRTVSIAEERNTAIRWEVLRPPQCGDLYLDSNPTGASVLFEGLPWGKTPLTLSGIPSRKPLQLALFGEGGGESTLTLQVQPKERKNLLVTLQVPRISRLYLPGIPVGTPVTLVGPAPSIRRQTRPLPEGETMALLPGPYTVEASPEGFYGARLGVLVGPETTTALLSPLPRRRLGGMAPLLAPKGGWGALRAMAADENTLHLSDAERDELWRFENGNWSLQSEGQGIQELSVYEGLVLYSANLKSDSPRQIHGDALALCENGLWSVDPGGAQLRKSPRPGFPKTGPAELIFALPWPRGSTPGLAQAAATANGYLAVAPAARYLLSLDLKGSSNDSPRFIRPDGLFVPAGVATDGRGFFVSDRETGNIHYFDPEFKRVDSWPTGLTDIGLLAYHRGKLYAFEGKKKIWSFSLTGR